MPCHETDLEFDFLLTENGDPILQEDGSRLVIGYRRKANSPDYEGGASCSQGRGQAFEYVSTSCGSCEREAPELPRPGHSGFIELFNVLDFGAKGDGITDDYDAISKTLTAAVAAGGGIIYFPGTRTYVVKKAGVHGIHINQYSNLTFWGGTNAVLVMDNLVNGRAVSHGIYVQGPCENITFRNMHVKYSVMSAVRQGWAPFYCLGANVGTGDMNGDGWYRGEPGGENVALIEAGSIRNLRFYDCVSENSPSVFLGLINTDGVYVENFKGIRSWADGIYNRCFRRHIVNGVELIECGDDCVSVGTEESNIALADINSPFHGEGSVFTNLSFDRSYDGGFLNTSGGIALLGVRDITFSNINIRGKYRAIRVEHGPETTGVYSRLNLSFLANRGVTINGVSASGGVQTLNVISKEIDIKTTDPKWWQQEILISDVTLYECNAPFSFSGMSGGLTTEGYVPMGPPVVYGFTFDGVESKSSVDNTFTSISGIYRCVFRNIKLDCQVNIKGSVPYTADPDAVDGNGDPFFPENDCVFENFTAAHINVTGLKRSRLINFTSEHSPQTGIAFVTCADIEAESVRVFKPNRLGNSGTGCYIDRYCKRFNIDLFSFETDDVWIENALSINNSENHWVSRVVVKTDLDRAYYMVSDHAKNNGLRSQIGQIDVYHTAVTTQDPRWRSRIFSRDNIGQPGDVDVTIYPEGDRILDLKYPLTAPRTVTISENAVNYGDTFTISRLPSSTGNYPVIIQGQASGTSERGEVRAEGNFLVLGGSAGSGNRMTHLYINGVNVLTAPVPYTRDPYNTAQAIAAAVNPTLYESFAVDYLVFIRDLPGRGSSSNGHVINPVTEGNFHVGYVINMNGGVDDTPAGPTPPPYHIYTMPPGQHGTVVVRFTGTQYELSSTTFPTLPVTITANSSLVIVEAGDDPSVNAQAALTAYALAKTLAPNGMGRSATNRVRVLLPPAHYDFGVNGQFVLDTQHVDVTGLLEDGSTVLTAEHNGTDTGTIRQYADNIRIENLTVRATGTGGGSGGARPAAYFPSPNLPGTVVRNCNFEVLTGNNYVTRRAVEYSGYYENIRGGEALFGDGGSTTCSGEFVNCVGGDGSFAGRGGTASGTFKDCVGGVASFGGGGPSATSGTASGTFTRCTGGDGSFAAANTSSGSPGTLSGKLFYCNLTAGTIPTISGSGKVVHCIEADAAAPDQ